MAKQVQVKDAVHPGRTIKKHLIDQAITVKDAAKKTKMAPTMLSEILSGKRAVTTLSAVRLEKALGLDALQLTYMQARYEYYTMVAKSKKKAGGKKKAAKKSRRR